MNGNKKRKPYRIINKTHQYRFLFTILGYGIAIAGFMAVTFLIPDIIKIYDPTLNIEIRAMAADRILTVHSRAWPAVLALICLIGLHSVRIFNRTVGPLYRFTIAFKEVIKGNLSYHVFLRKKDHLHSEASVYNEMLNVISNKLEAIQIAGQESKQLLKQLENTINKAGIDNEPVKKQLDALGTKIDNIAENAGFFRIENRR